MKIAVWLNKNYRPEVGGGFSYYDRLIKAIDAYSFDSSLEICFVTESSQLDYSFSRPVIHVSYSPLKPKISLLYRMAMKLPVVGKSLHSRFFKKLATEQRIERENTYKKILEDSSVRIIYYIHQTECIMPDFPFVATNWDIGHCSTYAFPEMIVYGEFLRRKDFYTQVLPKALMIFVESKMSKLELVRYTNINDARIRVVPLFAGNCVDIKVGEEEQKNILAKYHLEKHHFFFYPAQFWAHKNHAILLRAFAKYSALYPDYKLVLTGSDQGNLNYIRSLSHQLKIENNVLFLDFVSVECIHTFYRNTTALVMASYLGPTNMPPIEAMELGCPVICSDIEGHHEILSDSAIYFDPMSESELYEALLKMNDNYTSYTELILKQKELSLFRIDHSLRKINDYLKEVSVIRNCWK